MWEIGVEPQRCEAVMYTPLKVSLFAHESEDSTTSRGCGEVSRVNRCGTDEGVGTIDCVCFNLLPDVGGRSGTTHENRSVSNIAISHRVM